MPTTYTTRNGSGKSAGGFNMPQKQQSSTVGSSLPVPSASILADNNVVGRKKSLLPQRTVVRSQASGLKRPQIQSTSYTQTQTKAVEQQAPVEVQQALSDITSEPSEADHESVKEAPQTAIPNTNPPSRPKTERTLTRPRSPIKPQQNETKPTAPVAMKKAVTLPPARPTRSASLRQPSAPKVVSSTDGKGHARHRSQVLGARTVASVLPASSSQAEKSGPGSGSTAKQLRPQFSTYQQHFSPKKETSRTLSVAESRAGKPIESDALAASRPETAALQTELLQLYLLHSTSLQQDKEWKATAELQLQEKYRSVAAKYSTLLEEERHVQERLNLHALHDWSVESASLIEGDNGSSFQAQIQSFSRVTQDVADMTAAGTGRYTLVVQAFEEWLARVELVKQTRKDLSTFDTHSGETPQYIDTLGRQWTEEVDDLTIKAERCLRELMKATFFTINEDEFHRKHGNSALVQIARRHRDILTSMVDELKAMRAVEYETVNLEKTWISHAADRVEVDDASNSRIGIWRTVDR